MKAIHLHWFASGSKIKTRQKQIFRVSYNSDFIYTSLDMIKQYTHLLNVPFKPV